MKLNKLKPLVDSLTDIDKLAMYMNYYCNNLEFKHVYGGNINTFEYWTSKDRIRFKDHGDDYKERGIASRFRVEFEGIYDYINKQ